MSFTDPAGTKRLGAVQALLLSIAGSAAFTAVSTVVIVIAGTGIADVVLSLLTLVVSFVTASIVIGVSAVVVGLPLTWVLSQSRLEQPWIYPLCGFVTGALLIGAYGLARESSVGLSSAALPFTLLGALPGSICGAIWWLAYRRHRQEPELDMAVFD